MLERPPAMALKFNHPNCRNDEFVGELPLAKFRFDAAKNELFDGFGDFDELATNGVSANVGARIVVRRTKRTNDACL